MLKLSRMRRKQCTPWVRSPTRHVIHDVEATPQHTLVLAQRMHLHTTTRPCLISASLAPSCASVSCIVPCVWTHRRHWHPRAAEGLHDSVFPLDLHNKTWLITNPKMFHCSSHKHTPTKLVAFETTWCAPGRSLPGGFLRMISLRDLHKWRDGQA